MKKVIVVTALVCSIVVLAAQPGMAAGKPSYGCPPGFVGYTLEEGLALPRVPASIEAGIFTVEGVAFVFTAIDHNLDGITCFQDVATLNGADGHYANGYNLVDNNASVPG